MDQNNRVLRVAAKAVIEAEGGILSLHPSKIDLNRNWQMPGGIRDEIDEPISETAIREVREETGIDLSNVPGKVIKVGEWPAVDQGEQVKIVAIFYHFVLPKRPIVTLSHEHDDSVWLDKENFRSYHSNQEVYDLVEDLL